MNIVVENHEREVKVNYEGHGLWKCFVGKAIVYWRKGYKEPYVIIPGKRLEEIKLAKPAIVAFLEEYKRLVTSPKDVGPMSFVGEEGEYEYKYKEQTVDHDYVSGVPKWITSVKVWQVCSGKFRTYKRRVRIPQEYKEVVQKYMPHCCNCCHRVECNGPCLTPEINSKDVLLDGLSAVNFQ